MTGAVLAMMTRFALLSTAILVSSGCAYRFGQGARALPGGYRQMSIPMFKNRTQDVGVEVSFTQALQQEFLRSKVARVVDDPLAEVRVEGEITQIDTQSESKQTPSDLPTLFLPTGTVISTEYTVKVVVSMRIVRRSDNEKNLGGSLPRGIHLRRFEGDAVGIEHGQSAL